VRFVLNVPRREEHNSIKKKVERKQYRVEPGTQAGMFPRGLCTTKSRKTGIGQWEPLGVWDLYGGVLGLRTLMKNEVAARCQWLSPVILATQ
jgi:hypothetical protein